ncbi:hypothetical protein M2396_002761 [Pseudomonas sp. BIGb0278]|uniref:hypothetical protein n=1 Tax=Pseudomonas sp. BIGb0278 TaxID=2940607 RepID=UPI00216916C3|nr:hypothetical protein [Pseudomonas sp. BIGb0278]MCS4284465.1 hypothetical protein [Pseudomonas sp. BIGb0278]
MPSAQTAARWCPDECPITGRKFFMWIEHPDGGMVPTYGGPFDSYTIPTRDGDEGFCCERYDHDYGGWRDDEMVGLKLIDDQSDECEHGQVAELQAEIERLKGQSRVITLSGCEFTEDDLLARAVRGVSGTGRQKRPRWALMTDVFLCGSGVAHALCRRFGVDPNEDLRK